MSLQDVLCQIFSQLNMLLISQQYLKHAYHLDRFVLEQVIFMKLLP